MIVILYTIHCPAFSILNFYSS